jgi:hypothetical protein
MDNSAGRIINRKLRYDSLCIGKNKHKVTTYLMVYEAMSHVTVSNMRELSHSYISCLK